MKCSIEFRKIFRKNLFKSKKVSNTTPDPVQKKTKNKKRKQSSEEAEAPKKKIKKSK